MTQNVTFLLKILNFFDGNQKFIENISDNKILRMQNLPKQLVYPRLSQLSVSIEAPFFVHLTQKPHNILIIH